MPHVNTFVTQQLIGPYVVDELPAPLQITFKDFQSNIIDLTGFTATFDIIRLDGTTPTGIGAGIATIPSPASGLTQYAWALIDFQSAGMYRGVMWVRDGSQRYASEFFEWFVRDSQTTAPSL